MSSSRKVVVGTKRRGGGGEEEESQGDEAPNIPRRANSASSETIKGKPKQDDDALKKSLAFDRKSLYDDKHLAISDAAPPDVAPPDDHKLHVRQSQKQIPIDENSHHSSKPKAFPASKTHPDHGKNRGIDDKKWKGKDNGDNDEKNRLALAGNDDYMDDLARSASLMDYQRDPRKPGAFALDGIAASDDGTVVYDSVADMNPPVAGATVDVPYYVSARLVEDNDEERDPALQSLQYHDSTVKSRGSSIAIAEVADLSRNRRIVRGLIIALAVAVIAAVVVGVTTTLRSNKAEVVIFGPMSAPPSNIPSTAPSSAPSLFPSIMPTVIPWTLTQAIHGQVRDEFFGFSVELSDDGLTLAVGAPLENDGSVRVYRFISESWTALGQNLRTSFNVTWFGVGLALSGDGTTVAVSGGGNEENPFVEIFRFNSNSWVRIGMLTGVGYGALQESVALSNNGRILAVGSPINGTVKVFERINATNVWAQLGPDITGRLPSDEFGQSVDLSNDGLTVVVGAPGINDTIGGEAGASGTPQTGYARAYSYSYGTKNWSLFGTDNMQGLVPGDQTGWTVAISGDGRTVAVGATLNDVAGENAGTVRVFKYNSDNLSWLPYGNTIPGEAALDNSGWSLDISSDGSTIIVGAPGNKGRSQDDDFNPINFNAGHARVYRYSNTSDLWAQVGADIDGELARDMSGYNVAISSGGNVVVIGAPYSNGGGLVDAGQVRVYNAPEI